MTPRLRALSLTAHVRASVGRFGAAPNFLALAIIGVTRGPADRTGVVRGHAPLHVGNLVGRAGHAVPVWSPTVLKRWG